jgi:hypothetical protein
LSRRLTTQAKSVRAFYRIKYHVVLNALAFKHTPSINVSVHYDRVAILPTDQRANRQLSLCFEPLPTCEWSSCHYTDSLAHIWPLPTLKMRAELSCRVALSCKEYMCCMFELPVAMATPSVVCSSACRKQLNLCRRTKTVIRQVWPNLPQSTVTRSGPVSRSGEYTSLFWNIYPASPLNFSSDTTSRYYFVPYVGP